MSAFIIPRRKINRIAFALSDLQRWHFWKESTLCDFGPLGMILPVKRIISKCGSVEKLWVDKEIKIGE